MSSREATRLTDRLFWPKPRGVPPLGKDVHVWAATLDRPTPVLKSFWDILSHPEKARAERFHHETDRRRFVASHGMLRLLLGAYLQRNPEDLRFDQSPQGKPSLVEVRNGTLLFNMAHSEGLALYAVARDREVGIDVEWHREDLETKQIAEQFFSPAEVSTLRSIPRHQQKEAFFNCWTRKEAFLKAIGQGLSTELDQFEVAFAPGQKPAILKTVWNPGEALRWNLVALHPNPFYSAALVAEGRNIKLGCWTWDPEPEPN